MSSGDITGVSAQPPHRYVEVDGQVPTNGELASLLFDNYGHFTAMQVRDGKTRGLDLHAERLVRQHHDVFGEPLDTDLVLALAEQALIGHPNASVRIVLTHGPHVTVLVDPPADVPSTPMRLKTVVTERHLPHVKHLGTFMQRHHAAQAIAGGADDALFVTAEGSVLESSVWNIGFVFDSTAVFPDGPRLHGITEHLLRRHAPEGGIRVSQRSVELSDVSQAQGAFLTNSWGVVPVAAIDATCWSQVHDLVRELVTLYRELPVSHVGPKA